MAGRLDVTPVRYQYLLFDTSTGTDIGEIPWTPTGPFRRTLNGVGDFPGTVPLYAPIASYTNWQGDREMGVVRNGDLKWNGPLTLPVQQASFRSPKIQVLAREAHWYLKKRVYEGAASGMYQTAMNFNADLFYIARAVVAYATSKVSRSGDGYTPVGSSLNAGIPRFSVAPATGSSGTTKAVRWLAAARPVILDMLDELVADPTTGLEYKMVYTSSGGVCNRTLTFGSPALGTTHAHELTERVLYDFGKTEDRERAANRVHTLGAGYVETLQNASSITGGDILLEEVFDRSDTSNQTALLNFTRDARRRSIPPVSAYTFTYAPGNGPLDFDWCDLGDTVTMNVGGSTVLRSVGQRRIVDIAVMPPVRGSKELVTCTVNVPLDQLGT